MDSQIPIEQLASRIPGVSLDMDSESMRKAGYRVVDWLIERMENLPESPLGRELRREETEQLLRQPMPEDPSAFEEVFEEYTRNVAPRCSESGNPSADGRSQSAATAKALRDILRISIGEAPARSKKPGLRRWRQPA